MMQRRRPTSPVSDRAAIARSKSSSSSNNNNNTSDKSLNRTNSFTATAMCEQQQPKPIVPLWLVAAICLFFLTAGFLQQHFEESRSTDPLTGRKMYHNSGITTSQQQQHYSKAASAAAADPTPKRTAKNNNDQARSNSGTMKGSLLSAEQDAALEFDTAHNNVRYHVVFSTDCSPYQHWQSYAVFYTAMKVSQPGHVTRIASGCDAEQEAAMRHWFAHSVSVLSPHRFHLHLTPKFSSIVDADGNPIGDYKFFNKPYGLKHWMEHSELLHFNRDTKHFPLSVHSDVVILIDPDMILLRPLTADFSNPRETLYGPARQQHKLADTVGPGQPFAQVYGFGTQWSRLDLEKIAGPGTPAVSVNQNDGRLYYPAGPPYLAVTTDMYNIAVKWSEFVPGTYEQYPHLLAEMFAFSIAAAHLELPFSLVDSLMVSDVTATGGEGWALVDAIPAAQLCGFCQNEQDHAVYALPSVLHMCQRYMVGDQWFFTKRKIPSDIYDCEAPLFVEPPADLAVKYNYKHAPGGKRFDMTESEAKRQSFAICYIYAVLNEAAAFYKQNACPADKVNLEKTRNLVTYMAQQKEAAAAAAKTS